MTTAHDNEADVPSEPVTIECHADAAREAVELVALEVAAVLDVEACVHPEDMRIATLGGPGSFDCVACGFSVSTLSPVEAVEPEPEPTVVEPTPTGIVEHVDGQRITFTEDGLHVATIWQPSRDKDGKAPDFANWYTASNAGTVGGKTCIALARAAIMKELER